MSKLYIWKNEFELNCGIASENERSTLAQDW